MRPASIHIKNNTKFYDRTTPNLILNVPPRNDGLGAYRSRSWPGIYELHRTFMHTAATYMPRHRPCTTALQSRCDT